MYKKILLILAIIVAGLIGWSIYSYYSLLASDAISDPTVRVSSGSTTVVRWETAYDLTVGETFVVAVGDRVIASWDGLALIVWPDGSITRIGESTEITIREMDVASDYSQIRVSFDLDKWKIWTNVVRALFGDSVFETQIPSERVTAWVRGTIYEINLDRYYIHAVNHAVELHDGKNNAVTLFPGEVVAASNILQKLSRDILDQGWNLINEYADIEYIEKRTTEVHARIKSLAHEKNIFDRAIRWMLSFFPRFDTLRVARALEEGKWSLTSVAETVSTDTLVKWYQEIGWTEIPSDIKQALRETILEKATPEEKKKLEWWLLYGAIWDQFSLSGSALGQEMRQFIEEVGKSVPEAEKLYNELKQNIQLDTLREDAISRIKSWKEKIEKWLPSLDVNMKVENLGK